MKRAYLLMWCAALAILAFVLLEQWNVRNAPMHQRFERQWAEDVTALEASPKLPKPWFDVSQIEVIGGTPDTKGFLRRVQVPLKVKNPNGQYKLEALVVLWTEDNQNGVMIQYNITDLKTNNMVYELGRTLVLNQPKDFELW